MATLDDIFRQRWGLLDASIPYVPDTGIATFWRGHPEIGSPIGPEQTLDGGAVAQPFSGGVVVWDSHAGARLSTG